MPPSDPTSPRVFIVDPSEAEEFELRLVDPREILTIFVYFAANEPEIFGFINLESYVLSMFASSNPLVYPYLLQLGHMPALHGMRLSDSHDRKSLLDSVAKVSAKVFNEFKERGDPVRIYIQSRNIDNLPAGVTGPAQICMLISCIETRGRKSLIIPSDLELLPEFDASGNKIVEIRHQQ